MKLPETAIALKADDFNRVHVRGIPSSANSSKFSTASTVANLAVKLHRTPRLEPGTTLPFSVEMVNEWALQVYE